MDPWLDRLTTFAIGAAGGAVTALVALRTRLALMDVRMDRHDRELTDARKALNDRLKHMDDRQMLLLQLIAGIARKVGVDARFDDLVVRLLSPSDDKEA